jgi:cytidylate kinase
MRIITISREYGSGGREIGQKIAEKLGYDYYDWEIITAIATKSGLDEKYIEQILDNIKLQSFPLNYHCSYGSNASLQSNQINLLLEQKKVVENIAVFGRDCVIVGRNADVLLKKYRPFNIFVCASMESRIKRCEERAGKDNMLSAKEFEKKIKSIDKNRAHVRELLSGSDWGNPVAYHMTVNTTNWNINNLSHSIADCALRWFEK